MNVREKSELQKMNHENKKLRLDLEEIKLDVEKVKQWRDIALKFEKKIRN